MSNIQCIVLIDDNDADNYFHEITIRRAGFDGEIVVVENGIDALRYFETANLERPTLIFLDINMPGMSGFDVAERAAPMLEHRQSIVVMMLTSSSSPADEQRANSIKLIRGFITKPLTVEGISGLLEKRL